MIYDERLMIAAKIPVCQAIHQAVAERVELLVVRLHDAGAATASFAEGRDGDIGRRAQARRTRGEIRAQLIQAQAAQTVEIQEITRSSVGRWGGAVQIGRQIV